MFLWEQLFESVAKPISADLQEPSYTAVAGPRQYLGDEKQTEKDCVHVSVTQTADWLT